MLAIAGQTAEPNWPNYLRNPTLEARKINLLSSILIFKLFMS